ncbi:MAG: twitching motility protein PilT, partial [Actinobacteria bacterium]|nr:twitching motility protein PilT [Actinomycetota bacterium]NIS30677.1 twitching motility protein PilT [Actinomycetota bacterium]NIU65889.1 twitching motility protein PilT [Actinomycetota bacterium]NIV86767.1 twitching motility protein PilT [Actinomycetota bacterium]NIW27681.1 twitching motility protein PilT [Actinomycetota bacterium]
EIEAVARDQVLDRLPPRTRVEHDTFSRCGRCDRVYWPGSHVTALRRRFGDLLR